MLRQTSRPMKSASVSGPMGWFIPSFITLSMASGVATPSIWAKIASLINGISTRFEMKPGASFTSTGVFPSFFASSSVARVVSSEVWRPRMISTSSITGTGFMKCIPMKRSARLVAAASLVIEIDDVLVARIASGRRIPSSSRKSDRFASRSSRIASTTKSASDAPVEPRPRRDAPRAHRAPRPPSASLSSPAGPGSRRSPKARARRIPVSRRGGTPRFPPERRPGRCRFPSCRRR